MQKDWSGKYDLLSSESLNLCSYDRQWVESWTSVSNSSVFNSTDLAVMTPNSTVKRYLAYSTAS